MHSGDTDTGSSQFWELVLSQGHWYRQVPFWNSPSSLLVLGLALPTSRSAALRPAEPTATPGPSPVYQRAQDPAPHTSALALAPGTLGPSSTHQWASTSPRIPWAPTLPTSRPTPALRPSGPCSQRSGNPALSISELALAPGCPGFQSHLPPGRYQL